MSVIPFVVAAALVSTVPVLQAQAPRFVDGDRVAFIGDSITHGGSYHAYVYDYYLTRFPKMRVTIFNCGISGDSAWGANERFDWDIMSTHPTVATIMLGMNDVGRDAYGLAAATPQQLKQREGALDGYRANLQRLIDRLDEKQVRITLITPSPYDQTAKVPETNLFGVNDALAACGAFAKETAARRDFGLIDFNAQLTALNAEYQKTDPAKTLIGPDRVHPGELGHFLMAYYFLKAQAMQPLVAYVTIDATKKEVTEQAACAVKQLAVTDNSLTYTYLADALPYPITNTYTEANALVPFTKDLNVESIRVSGLADGSYALMIDGSSLGSFTSAELSAGINIATNPASPMQRQAQAVHAKNMERHANAQSVRTLAMLEAGMHQAKVNISDPAAVEKHFEQVRIEIKGKPWESYVGGQIDEYKKLKPREQEISNKVAELEKALFTLNQPAARTVTLKRELAKP